MLRLAFSSKLDSYIIAIAKTASKKIGALIRSMKFFSPKVALYKSTIRPCMENGREWKTVVMSPSCYLELLDKLQKWICRIVGPSLAPSLEPLTHRGNVTSLSLFYRYYFGRCSSELAQMVPLPYPPGRSRLVILIDCMILMSPFLDVTKMSMSSFFPHTARLWNSLH